MRRRGSRVLTVALVVAAGMTVGIVASVLAAAVLAPATPALAAAPPDLNTVVNNIRNWLVGMLVALATLFLTIGGIRYLLAGGDPGEVAKAKDTLKYAAIGYGVAVLAPVLVKILQGFVGR